MEQDTQEIMDQRLAALPPHLRNENLNEKRLIWHEVVKSDQPSISIEQNTKDAAINLRNCLNYARVQLERVDYKTPTMENLEHRQKLREWSVTTESKDNRHYTVLNRKMKIVLLAGSPEDL